MEYNEWCLTLNLSEPCDENIFFTSSHILVSLKQCFNTYIFVSFKTYLALLTKRETDIVENKETSFVFTYLCSHKIGQTSLDL